LAGNVEAKRLTDGVEQVGEVSGRAFPVTAADTGIGLATAVGRARDGGQVHRVCRPRQKDRPTVSAEDKRRSAADYDSCLQKAPGRMASPELAEHLWRHSAAWAGVG